MNSPPPITSRANRRRALSLDNPSTPLLGSIGRRRSDRRVRDEVLQRIQRMHVVSRSQCFTMYSVLALVYLAIIGAVFFARRPEGVVPALPEDFPAYETLPGTFNPYTAWEHLEAITKEPHNFNTRANTDVTKKYIRDQFKDLAAEAIAAGRRNVRYEDQDNTTWARIYKSKQQREEEQDPSTTLAQDTLERELVEYVQGDNLLMWVGGVVESEEDGVPVKIEIDVNQPNQNALLVSSHFDSVSTSNGATDDGGGVAVMLALIRHFIHHPVQHTIIFFFNNAEEEGLMGAGSFMGAPPNSNEDLGDGHPWKKFIRAVINLEGAGSGGPSLLFRASDPNIVRHYADNAPYPHASAFANSAFDARLIHSDTDYSIYQQHNLPGLDIAFYHRRSMYHTITDWLPIESLHHMGSNVQATITGICNSGYLDLLHDSIGLQAPLSPRSWFAGKGVFYDVLGRTMFSTELWTSLLVNLFGLGLGLPILTVVSIYVGWAIKSRKERRRGTSPEPQRAPTHSLRSVLDSSSISQLGHSDEGYTPLSQRSNSLFDHQGESGEHHRGSHSRRSIVRRYVGPVARTTFLIALIIALDLGAIAGLSNGLYDANPMVRFSSPWIVIFGFSIALLFLNTFLVYLFTVIETAIWGPVPIVRGGNQWTFALGVWWWLVVIFIGTGVAGWFKTGALYGTTVLALFSGAAGLLQILLCSWTVSEGVEGVGYSWVFILVTSLLAPGIVILDLLAVLIFFSHQSMIQSDFGLMYFMYGTALIPITLGAIPTISRARNFKKALLLELLAGLVIFWFITQLDPYTAESPTSLYYYQEYNQTSKTSAVTVATDSGAGYLHKLVKDIPTIRIPTAPTDESSASSPPVDNSCVAVTLLDGFMEQCIYKPERQVFEDDGWVQPIHVDWLDPPTRGVDGWTEGRLQIQALETRMCTVRIPQTSVGHESQLLMDALTDEGKRFETPLNYRPKTLNVFLREWNRPWSITIRVKGLPQDTPDEGDEEGDEGRKKKTPSHKKREPIGVQVVCQYDDWVASPGYATEYNTVRTHIPEWARMRTHTGHLFSVGVDIEF
ncbi:hypothetical protein BGZ52_000723 [Haplosporangium bisporale]|nr:hypothetical protein BGZ52_000723 [Haplosporangium bisporale]